MKKLILLLALTGCTIVKHKPDIPAPVLNEKGTEYRPANVEHTLDVMRANLPCAVSNRNLSLSITWVSGPFYCQGVKAAGCWTGVIAIAPMFVVSGLPDFPDAADSALIHEVGHYAWGFCGRTTMPDFAACAKQGLKEEDCPHPPDFIAWVEATKAKARSH